MPVLFSKYAGCGNDFILIDNREHFFPIADKDYIRSLCHRQLGIGADGIVLLENSSKVNFKMRIFNSDGSEAEMCGNGIRCLLQFIRDLGFFQEKYVIETMHDCLEGTYNQGQITMQMPLPRNTQWDVKVGVLPNPLHYMEMGVPHAVIFVEDLDSLDVAHYGSRIRSHSHFAPKGVNVNFVHILKDGEIKLRTYERGVEDETLACGTGATASALVASHLYRFSSPVHVFTRSKEMLQIKFQTNPEGFSNITMTGHVNFIFKGSMNCDMKKSKTE